MSEFGLQNHMFGSTKCVASDHASSGTITTEEGGRSTIYSLFEKSRSLGSMSVFTHFKYSPIDLGANGTAGANVEGLQRCRFQDDLEEDPTFTRLVSQWVARRDKAFGLLDFFTDSHNDTPEESNGLVLRPVRSGLQSTEMNSSELRSSASDSSFIVKKVNSKMNSLHSAEQSEMALRSNHSKGADNKALHRAKAYRRKRLSDFFGLCSLLNPSTGCLQSMCSNDSGNEDIQTSGEGATKRHRLKNAWRNILHNSKEPGNDTSISRPKSV